jgi:predicted RNA-binding Zn-ribbon protein involved in translation (DUF1610 family)
MSTTLVKMRGWPYVVFNCPNCGARVTEPLSHIAGSEFSGTSLCLACRTESAIPPVPCFYAPDCGGTYERCGGPIEKLSAAEIAASENEVFKDVDMSEAKPTDEWHDYMGELRGSVVTYRCSSCGETYSAAQGVSLHLNWANRKCETIRCSACGRPVPTSDLPEPEATSPIS